MSGPFTHITRSIELDDRDVASAVAARDTTRALLVRLATVAAPESGVAKVLLIFARMATTACDWIDGDLCVDLVSDEDMTLIETSTELGGGLRERIFAPLPFRTPLSEFERAIDAIPDIIAPLTVRARSERRMTLSATEAVRSSTIPPPPVRIAHDSLFAQVTPALQAEDSDAGHGLPLVSHAPPEDSGPERGTESTGRPEPAPGDVDAGWDD